MTTTGAPGQPGAPVTPRTARIEAMVFVGLLIALSITVLVVTGTIREPVGSTNTLGARVVPYAVGSLMLVASIAVLIGQLRGNYGQPEDGEDVDPEKGTSWTTVSILALSFASLIFTIPMFGWVPAVTVLFAGAAISLGAKVWWVAVLVGAVLGIVTWVVFDIGLGLSLPATGSLTAWIPIG